MACWQKRAYIIESVSCDYTWEEIDTIWILYKCFYKCSVMFIMWNIGALNMVFIDGFFISTTRYLLYFIYM